jgi:hypothetical protein
MRNNFTRASLRWECVIASVDTHTYSHYRFKPHSLGTFLVNISTHPFSDTTCDVIRRTAINANQGQIFCVRTLCIYKSTRLKTQLYFGHISCCDSVNFGRLVCMWKDQSNTARSEFMRSLKDVGISILSTS